MKVFRKTLRVRFALVDLAGVLFFAHALTLAHELLEDFVVEGLGLPWEGWFDREDWGLPCRQATVEYLRPARPGEVLEGRLEVVRVGTSSVSFRTEFVNGRGETVFTAAFTGASVDRRSWSKRALPPEVAARLRRFLAGP